MEDDLDYNSKEERSDDTSIESNEYSEMDQNELADILNDQYVLKQETEGKE